MTAPTDGPRNGSIRVAILDDHRLIAESLGSALRAHDLSVEITTSSWTQLLDHESMPVDVAIVDLRIDDGVTISSKVRELDARGVPTIVMSSRPNATLTNAALRAGAVSVVAKSESIDSLLETVRSVAEGPTALLNAEAEQRAAHEPVLGAREERALVLFAGGRSIREVALDMGTTDETVKSYIKRARRKFRAVGVDLGTRILLRRYAAQEGWLGHD